MKSNFSAPISVPRLNSLLDRLQKARGPEDEPSYLDQLMVFLEEPPKDVRDRWKTCAEMCAGWGIKCSGASVYRLFQSHAVEWRAGLALQTGDVSAESLDALQEKAARLTALRVCAMLNDPRTSPAVLLSLLQYELRRQGMVLAREKQQDAVRDQTERALTELSKRCARNRMAQFALVKLKDELEGKGEHSDYNPFFHPVFSPAKPYFFAKPGKEPSPEPVPPAKSSSPTETAPPPKPK